MRLLRDLCGTSPRRTAALGLLIVFGAVGQAVAAAVARRVLLHRSWSLFVILAVALVSPSLVILSSA